MELYRLTDQTIRRGIGDRWSAFLYVLNIENNQDKQDNQNKLSKDALLFVFRMKGAQRTRTIKLMGLEPQTTYVLENIDTGLNSETTGDKLMDVGLLFDLPEEDSSEIIHLKLSGAEPQVRRRYGWTH